ncbi:hypothetical protein CEXT_442421 [Caerostris extrusa]|uniref:Uncharacterized protein n=1 Tax=Caerostris extrusa TaxID=172846 RepID=A0AAV4WY96_CAEEX|nr:hypothetical protein CEXT_442421 [Caerostris extrusa]
MEGDAISAAAYFRCFSATSFLVLQLNNRRRKFSGLSSCTPRDGFRTGTSNRSDFHDLKVDNAFDHSPVGNFQPNVNANPCKLMAD